MNADTSIPMIHASALPAWLDTLAELGVPLQQGLRAAKMPPHILEEQDGYVPFKITCDWVHSEARRQGIDNFGLRSSLNAGPAVLAESVRNTIAAAPTLYQGMCNWANLIQRESSHAKIWLDDSGKDLHLRMGSTFAQDMPGQSDWIWFASALHMSVARLFLGPKWYPKEMAVPDVGRGLAVAQELLPDTRLIRDPKFTGLTIPRHLLGTPPLATAGGTAAGDALPSPPDSLEASLAEMVRFCLPDGPPRIELAAEAAGLSVRTLQRRLAARNLHYDQMVSNVRFEQARGLLEQADLSIAEIARQLGYRYPTHFTRAFRRIAGTSPRDYRRQLKH